MRRVFESLPWDQRIGELCLLVVDTKKSMINILMTLHLKLDIGGNVIGKDKKD